MWWDVSIFKIFWWIFFEGDVLEILAAPNITKIFLLHSKAFSFYSEVGFSDIGRYEIGLNFSSSRRDLWLRQHCTRGTVLPPFSTTAVECVCVCVSLFWSADLSVVTRTLNYCCFIEGFAVRLKPLTLVLVTVYIWVFTIHAVCHPPLSKL